MSLLVNDPVHGHIDLNPAALLIISTPEFQRLNDLSQMGTAKRVFPGAHHTRFEHSIGVAHLAGRLIRHLQTSQPSLGITSEEILCVELAGLCHDLGHGPFSHLYENFCRDEGKEVTHEHLSFQILTHIIEKYDLGARLYTFGLNDAHISMIGEMMWGGASKAPENWKWKGPPMGKEFLYEIVSNDITDIDVDKFDYYLRDCRGSNISISFDPLRLMRLTKALKVADGSVHLCYALKDYWNVCEVFRTRFILFTRLYTHKTVVAADLIMKNLLKALAKHPCPWEVAEGKSILHAADNLDFYTSLTDGVIELTRVEPFASDPEVQRWFKAWRGRHLPKMKEEVSSPMKEGSGELEKDLETTTSVISYGGKGSTPLENVFFYDRHEETMNGSEAEAILGPLLNPPFKIYKHRVYEFRNL